MKGKKEKRLFSYTKGYAAVATHVAAYLKLEVYTQVRLKFKYYIESTEIEFELFKSLYEATFKDMEQSRLNYTKKFYSFMEGHLDSIYPLERSVCSKCKGELEFNYLEKRNICIECGFKSQKINTDSLIFDDYRKGKKDGFKNQKKLKSKC